MKKKMTLASLCLLMGVGAAVAQNTKVTGHVVDETGEPVIGASIVVKGTTIGTVTDFDGNFELEVPADGKHLEISYIGMQKQTVQVAPNVSILMKSDTQNLDEVVVTAMGIKRSEKAIGFSATAVNGEELQEKRTGDIVSGLAGKVAGVQISSASSNPGGSNSVVIRGISSLSGSNQPLYVIDGVPLSNDANFADPDSKNGDPLNAAYDFGSGANAVNPNDVASMTILKGAAATALYGSRAANGVILITTKSGDKNQGLGVTYNGGMQFESVLRLPEFQNEFGMGSGGLHTLIENQSYGPRFDGSMMPWGTVYNNSQKIKPYSPIENNVRDFFSTGLRYSNDVAINGGNDKGNYYASISQQSNNGIMPTRADTYDRYTFSMRGSYTFDKLTVSSSVNYTTQKNNFATTGQGLTALNSLYQIPRDISIIGLKDLDDPFNSKDYYFTPYGVANPYYLLEMAKNTYHSDKTYGKLEAAYEILPGFKATYRVGLDATNSEQKMGVPQMMASEGTPNYGQLNQEGTVTKEMIRQREINHDMLLTYDRAIQDFHLNALVGLNVNERQYSRLRSEIQGLSIDEWYNISNSSAAPQTEEEEWKRRLIGVFAQVELGYKSLAYLTLTARNDWSSTLPKENNHFFYPGVTGSFVFTELLPEETKDWLTFGKVRIAWGQTGNDANVYLIDPYYAQTSVNLGFGEINFPLNGFNAFTESDILGNPTLSPEITTEFEVGANVSFFNGRLSFDAAYYSRTSDKQIFALNVDPASGYNTQNVNMGKIGNKGVELLVSATPVQIGDFSWDVSWNFTKNNSKVISLPEEMGGEASIFGFSGGTGMYAIEGMPLGVYKAQVAQRDPNGNIIVNASTGLPEKQSDLSIVGDMNYDYEMGVSTTFTYKGFSLGADFDIRQGGLMFSNTKSISYFTGNAIQTAYNDRNPFVIPGSVNAVTDANGNVSYVENATPVSMGNIGNYWIDGGSELASAFLMDKSYVKLRSLTFGWDMPKVWFEDSFFKSVKLSLFATNLFVWTPSDNTFIDPEVSSFGNDLVGRFGEYLANPATRKYGFNIAVKF